jgi:hypothetical protein
MAYIQDADVKDATQAGGANRLVNASKIYVTSLLKTLSQAILDGDIGATPTYSKETLTLVALDISNGYKDLADEAVANSLILVDPNRQFMIEGVHYSLSVVALVTRITFLGAYASSGSSALDEGMELYANYTV